MSQIFIGADYSLPPKGSYVNSCGVSDIEKQAVRDRLVSMLATKDPKLYSTQTARDILSLCLAENNIQKDDGVNFKTFNPEPNDERRGLFSPRFNEISIKDNLLQSERDLHLVISVLAHEACHKGQQDLDTHFKYFGKDGNARKVGDIEDFGIVCGFVNPIITYHATKIEQEASAYEFSFAKKLLEDAKAKAEANNNKNAVNYLQEQLNYLKVEKDNKQTNESNVKSRFENKEAMDKYVQKATDGFSRYFDLARIYVSGNTPSSDRDKESLELLQKTKVLKTRDPLSASIEAMNIITARYPKRELVKTTLNFALSSNVNDVAPRTVASMFRNGVELSKKDIAKIILNSDYYRMEKSEYHLDFLTSLRTEEPFFAKMLTISQGPKRAATFLKNTKNIYDSEYKKTTEFPVKVDFGKMEQTVSSFEGQKPFIYVGNQPIYSCSQILDYAVDRLVYQRRVSIKDYNVVKCAISDNLADILNEFDFNPNSLDLSNALVKFVNNPLERQFQTKKDFDAVTEVSSVYETSIATLIKNKIVEDREKQSAKIINPNNGSSKGPIIGKPSSSQPSKGYGTSIRKTNGSVAQTYFKGREMGKTGTDNSINAERMDNVEFDQDDFALTSREDNMPNNQGTTNLAGKNNSDDKDFNAENPDSFKPSSEDVKDVLAENLGAGSLSNIATEIVNGIQANKFNGVDANLPQGVDFGQGK